MDVHAPLLPRSRSGGWGEEPLDVGTVRAFFGNSRTARSLLYERSMARYVLQALVAFALLSALGARQASAKLRCPKDGDLGLGYVEAFATMLTVPSLVVNGSDTPRRLVGVSVPGAAESQLGFGLGLELRCSFLVFDWVSFRYAASFTGGTEGSSPGDGTQLSAGRGSLHMLDIGLPLAGLPTGFQVFPDDVREYKIAVRLDVGLERIWADATVRGAGVPDSPASIDTWSPYVRAQAAGCRRLGHDISEATAWACFTVSPVLYDRSAFPGVSAGLRLDL